MVIAKPSLITSQIATNPLPNYAIPKNMSILSTNKLNPDFLGKWAISG